jgi:xanthine dehydrogenase YagS FAD-binding subunit
VRAFSYERAVSLAEGGRAVAGGARALAGGTDLVPLMKDRLFSPERVVDLSALDGELRAVTRTPDGGLALGALVTLAELARSEPVRREYAALAQAAASAASPQLRNVATLGGNLCQWNRCWYFRGGVPCHLSGGDSCPALAGDHRFHAVFRDGPCIAVHPSDPAVPLLAFGARVRVHGPSGRREVPLAAFLRAPRPGSPEQAELAPGELVEAVLLPPADGPSLFHKAMERRVWAFALASVAAVVRVADGRVERAAIALGGLAGVPRAAAEASRSLVGAAWPLGEDEAERAAEWALRGADPPPLAAYKVDLARRLVRAVLLELAGRGD